MNNIDKAAKLLVPNPTWCERVHKGEGGHPCMYCEADAEAGAVLLADAGLLAPDLPEPAPLTAANGNPVWRADNTLIVTRYPDGEIGMMITPEQEARYTPQAARDQAALLLAAANYAEGSQE